MVVIAAPESVAGDEHGETGGVKPTVLPSFVREISHTPVSILKQDSINSSMPPVERCRVVHSLHAPLLGILAASYRSWR